MLLYYLIGAIVLLTILFFVAAFVCYRLTFFVPEKCKNDVFSLPDTEQYSPYKEKSHKMIEETLKVPYESVTITAFDGITLFGKLYVCNKNAPVEIMMHGYRSVAERDFGGGVKIALAGGLNVLLIDQRAHGKSGGKALSFGVNERFDCQSWINFALKRFGENTKILLYGMSMGAATVLMTADLNLPKNVVGIVADCGYNAPDRIIKKVIKDMKFPLFPTYFLIRLGGKIFGKFDIENASATNALKSCNIPVLFIHGGDDRFVPCEMGKENFNVCASKNKRILIIDGAGHGVSYMVDNIAYMQAVSDFFSETLEMKIHLQAI